jgi:hypothetical protein
MFNECLKRSLSRGAVWGKTSRTVNPKEVRECLWHHALQSLKQVDISDAKASRGNWTQVGVNPTQSIDRSDWKTFKMLLEVMKTAELLKISK